MAKKKIIIGNKDIAHFPLLNMENVPVKVDSGAYTSSIHYYKVKIIQEEGQEKLKCYFISPKNKGYENSIFVFDEFGQKKVKSSNGISELRYSIKTKIKLFGKSYSIELTLSKRSRMKFKVLLGRKFLSKKFVIDTSLSNLSAKKSISSI